MNKSRLDTLWDKYIKGDLGEGTEQQRTPIKEMTMEEYTNSTNKEQNTIYFIRDNESNVEEE